MRQARTQIGSTTDSVADDSVNNGILVGTFLKWYDRVYEWC